LEEPNLEPFIKDTANPKLLEIGTNK